MRRMLIVASIAGLVACGSSDATGPAGPAIEVRVIDDVGAPVDRIRVVVSVSPTEKVRALTGKKGTVRIPVAAPGNYEVSVIPRAGYLGAPGTLTTTVIVADDSNADVGFTVHRESWVLPPPSELPL